MKNQTLTQTTNIEEIHKEIRTLASVDVGFLGAYARRALKDRIALLAFQLQQAQSTTPFHA